MGRVKIGYGVEVEYLPSDAKMGDYPQFKDSFWTMSPEHKHDAIGRIFSSGAAGVNPLTWMLSKFPKKVLQDGYEWKWHENGSTLRDQLGLYRKVRRVTTMTDKQPVAMHIKGEYGIYRIWADTIQLEMFQEFAAMKERILLFGIPCDILDANGQPVRSATGIREKLRGSNIEHYNNLTPKTILDFVMDALVGNHTPNLHRHILCCTCLPGWREFNRAMSEWVDKMGITRITMSTGWQYNLPMNVTITIMLFDTDQSLAFEIDPRTGYATESMRMTFLDLTEIDGEPNVQLVEHKNGLIFNFVAGTIGPNGPTPMGQAAHTGSYFNYVMEENIGIHIRDISRCGELIYAVQ